MIKVSLSYFSAAVISWMKGAQQTYNITVDYMFADWNERGWNAAFVKVRLPVPLSRHGPKSQPYIAAAVSYEP
jgi:hypothetical protein